MKTTLLAIKQIAPNYFECRFEKPSGFHFKAGQYCELGLDDESFFRPYSIACAPHEDELVFHIKKSEDMNSFSQTIISKSEIGSTFFVKHPSGHMIFDETKKDPVLFLAGGVGFAPFYSILNEAFYHKHTHRPFAFYWECKTKEDFYFLEELEEILSHFEHASLLTTLTSEKTVAGAVLEDFDTLHDLDIYVAGAPDMAFKTIELLETIGLNKQRLYCDYIQNHKQ